MSFLKYCTFTFLLVLSCLTYAQEFKNIQLTQRGDFVDITFDLAGTEGRTYTILVFSSHNDSSQPLEFVIGDIGQGIIPGEGKKIVWNANLEVGNQNVTVRISLEGDTDPPFLRIIEHSGGKFKKGKPNEISWEGETDDRIRIELLKAGKSYRRIGDVPNNGSYMWSIPKDFKNGKDYQLKFSNLGNSNEYITTQNFVIGPQFGIGLKAAGVVALGIATYFIIDSFGSKEEPILLPAKPDE